MKPYSNLIPVIVFFTYFVLNGCEKETIVEKEVERVRAWNPVAAYSNDNRMQLNSYGDSAGLYTMNLSYFSIGVQSPSVGRFYVDPSILYLEPSIYEKFPICGRYFAVAEDNVVLINISNEPQGYYADAWLFMNQIDSNFTKFEFPRRWLGNAIGINGKNSVLIPYRRNDTDYSKAAAMLVTFSITPYYSTQKLDTISTTIITFGMDDRPLSIHHFFDHYFFSGYQTYRIGNDGRMTVCFPGGMYNMFSDGNDLYSMSFGTMLRSRDHGVSWQKIGSIDGEPEVMNYTEIDGRIIAYRYSQLYHVTLNDSVNTIVELENDGLDGHWITSISRYQENFYVTTLSGVFSRSAKDFFVERKGSTLREHTFIH